MGVYLSMHITIVHSGLNKHDVALISDMVADDLCDSVHVAAAEEMD